MAGESCGIGAFLSCWLRHNLAPKPNAEPPINTHSRNSSPNCWHNVEVILRNENIMDDYCQMVPIGARLAELARLRLQYDESRRSVQVPTIS